MTPRTATTLDRCSHAVPAMQEEAEALIAGLRVRGGGSDDRGD